MGIKWVAHSQVLSTSLSSSGQLVGRAYSATVTKFYGRGNYQEEFDKEFSGPDVFAKQFFGERFSSEDVLSYKADIAIDSRTDLEIGGTKFELIPMRGGETHDAMLIYLPEEKVMFRGGVNHAVSRSALC